MYRPALWSHEKRTNTVSREYVLSKRLKLWVTYDSCRRGKQEEIEETYKWSGATKLVIQLWPMVDRRREMIGSGTYNAGLEKLRTSDNASQGDSIVRTGPVKTHIFRVCSS